MCVAIRAPAAAGSGTSSPRGASVPQLAQNRSSSSIRLPQTSHLVSKSAMKAPSVPKERKEQLVHLPKKYTINAPSAATSSPPPTAAAIRQPESGLSPAALPVWPLSMNR